MNTTTLFVRDAHLLTIAFIEKHILMLDLALSRFTFVMEGQGSEVYHLGSDNNQESDRMKVLKCYLEAEINKVITAIPNNEL